MDIYAIIKSLLGRLLESSVAPGYVPEDLDVRDAQYGMVFGETATATPPQSVDWRPYFSGKLSQQRAWPWCVSYAVRHLQEYNQAKEGIAVKLSARWLAARSGTSLVGNSIRNVLEVARKDGIVEEQDCPFDSSVPLSMRGAMFNLSAVTEDAKVRGKKHAIKGYAWVSPWDRNEIRRAVANGPLIIAYGIGPGYGAAGKVGNPPHISAYHCTLLLGYDQFDNWYVGDSLVPQEKLLSGQYRIPWICAVADLPSNWKELQEEHLYNSYHRLLKERFGQPRNILVEQTVAREIDFLMRGNKSPGLAAAVSRYAICYYAAATYSGYSVQEVMNHARHYAKTGQHLFDLNAEKP